MVQPHVETSNALMRFLVERAARRVPEEIRDRLREEWIAELGSRLTLVWQLRFAIPIWLWGASAFDPATSWQVEFFPPGDFDVDSLAAGLTFVSIVASTFIHLTA